MVVVEARDPLTGQLIEITEVSLTDSGRIMITDDQGHQVFIHRVAWIDVIKAVVLLLIDEGKQERKR